MTHAACPENAFMTMYKSNGDVDKQQNPYLDGDDPAEQDFLARKMGCVESEHRHDAWRLPR